MWRDLIHGLRVIRRYPLSSIAIVLVLALGIGANTAMFAIFRTWITKPLDFPNPERLMAPYAARPEQGEHRRSVSAHDADDWRRESRSLEGVALFDRHLFRVDDESDAEHVPGARIEAALFPLLGVAPVLGRTFSPDDDLPAQPAAVAIISDALWRRRFAADPGVIGRDLRLDGLPHQIVGVMEPGFGFPEWGEIWAPLGIDPAAEPRDRRIHDSVARLAPGITRKQAEEELRAIASRLAALHPQTNRGWSAELLPLRDKWLPDTVRVALSACLGAAFFVLLIICSNVAGLLLAQANSRTREMAVRAALGGGRGRLVRQTITECTTLAALGGVLGVPLGVLLNRWMSGWAGVRPPYLFEVSFDTQTILFAALATLVAGVACGLAPVARHASVAAWEALAGGRRVGAGPKRQRLAAILVAGELRCPPRSVSAPSSWRRASSRSDWPSMATAWRTPSLCGSTSPRSAIRTRVSASLSSSAPWTASARCPRSSRSGPRTACRSARASPKRGSRSKGSRSSRGRSRWSRRSGSPRVLRRARDSARFGSRVHRDGDARRRRGRVGERFTG